MAEEQPIMLLKQLLFLMRQESTKPTLCFVFIEFLLTVGKKAFYAGHLGRSHREG